MGEVEDLNLPVESARQSPDPEDSYMQDGPHPLSLLSDIGSKLRSSEAERPQALFQSTSAHGEPNQDIGPGWTSAQLQNAAARKRFYFKHGLSATKRDTLFSRSHIEGYRGTGGRRGTGRRVSQNKAHDPRQMVDIQSSC